MSRWQQIMLIISFTWMFYTVLLVRMTWRIEDLAIDTSNWPPR